MPPHQDHQILGGYQGNRKIRDKVIVNYEASQQIRMG